MSADRPNPEAKPGIGEMPSPRYMSFVDEDNRPADWIGMQAYSADGDIQDYLWYRNLDIDITKPEETLRDELAAFVARFSVDNIATDVAIGRAIDLADSDRGSRRVAVDEDPSRLGLYVRKDQRFIFNFRLGMSGLQTESYLRKRKPDEFENAYQKAKAVLPKLVATDSQPVSEQVLDERIRFVSGDITEIEADAIVCPSLPELDVLYTGVAGAIMRKGGDRIFAEARRIGAAAKREHPEDKFPIPPFSALMTNAGSLPNTRHVIHSVAVNITDEEGLSCDPETIFKSAWNVLEVANGNKLKSVAFPALGSGLYQVPVDQSFGAIAQAAGRFLGEHPETTISDVILVSRDPNLPKPSLTEELTADGWARELRARRN